MKSFFDFFSVKISVITASVIAAIILSFAGGMMFAIKTSATLPQTRVFFHTDIPFLLISVSVFTFAVAMLFPYNQARRTLMNVFWTTLVFGVALSF